MGPKKRLCKFSDDLRKDFPFLKSVAGDNDKVECSICNAIFSIVYGGRNDVTIHIKRRKHQDALQAKSSSQKIGAFFPKQAMGEMEKNLAAEEGTFSYHTVRHNHSFRSMDCTSQMIKKLYNKKFTCAKTKTKAIIVNVLAPYALSKLQQELKEANFISVMVDSSNHKDLKLVPILVRYYIPLKGVQIKILEFDSLPAETSEIITDHILQVFEKASLTDKIVAVSADNTNTNFGGAKRRGKINVFQKLCNRIERNIIGVGCGAHILHNAVQTAADCLPIDFQSVVNKLYQHFHIYTVRVEALKTFCESVDEEYKKVLGHCKTRWLSLAPALQRLSSVFDSLKAYFSSIEKCPTIIEYFFKNPQSRLLLCFLNTQLKLLTATIQCLERQNISGAEVKNGLDSLVEKLKNRKEAGFRTSEEKTIIQELHGKNLIDEESYNASKIEFYDTIINYVDEWAHPFKDMDCMMWVLLNKNHHWRNVEETLSFMKDKNLNFGHIDDAELFDEHSCVKKYVTDEKITSWNNSAETVSASDRWLQVFQHFEDNGIPYTNIARMVEFSLSLPGTNAAVERVFSLMNALWTDEKNQLEIETVKAMLVIKTCFTEKCSDFYDMIFKEKILLDKIHNADKYCVKKCGLPSTSTAVNSP